MTDNPNPYIKNQKAVYDPNESNKRAAENMGITVEQLIENRKNYWKIYDQERELIANTRIPALINELHHRIEYLLNIHNLFDENGIFIFPDGSVYRKEN